MLRRLLLILQIFTILSVRIVNGQEVVDTTIFVNVDDEVMAVGDLLELINEQTGYIFSYDTRIVNKNVIVSLPIARVDFARILDLLSSSLNLRYSVIDNYVILYKKQDSSGKLRLSGRVIDSDTREPLRFATIGIHNRGIGTVTNSDGCFILNVSPEYLEDTLTVSYVGYQNSTMVVNKVLDGNPTIMMYRNYVSIPEIIVRVRDPISVMDKTFKSTAQNYGITPALLTGFYREGVVRRKGLQVYSEAVIQIFKSSYNRGIVTDQVKVLQSRKIENTEAKDTLAIRLEDGIQTILELDVVKNLFDFMNPDSYYRYKYKLTDIVTVDDGMAFVISFEQHDWVEEPLFQGEIYISTENYAVVMAEFELNQSHINQINDEYVVRVPNSFSIKTDYVRYSVQYRREGDRYYLSHVRGDLGFIARGKRKLFNSHYDVFVELAVTGFQTGAITRFSKDEAVPSHTIFTSTITGYDSEFWKEFDFIQPDESLQKSLRQLKVKLGEYKDSSLQLDVQ